MVTTRGRIPGEDSPSGVGSCGHGFTCSPSHSKRLPPPVGLQRPRVKVVLSRLLGRAAQDQPGAAPEGGPALGWGCGEEARGAGVKSSSSSPSGSLQPRRVPDRVQQL